MNQAMFLAATQLRRYSPHSGIGDGGVEPEFPFGGLHQMVGASGIILAVVGLLMLHVFDRDDERWSRGAFAYVAGAALIVAGFLFLNPDAVESLTRHVGAVLVGLVIATFDFIMLVRPPKQ